MSRNLAMIARFGVVLAAIFVHGAQAQSSKKDDEAVKVLFQPGT